MIYDKLGGNVNSDLERTQTLPVYLTHISTSDAGEWPDSDPCDLIFDHVTSLWSVPDSASLVMGH